MNMVFTMGFRVQIFGRRCALEPAFFFIKRQYTEQLTDKQGEQFTEDSISQKHSYHSTHVVSEDILEDINEYYRILSEKKYTLKIQKNSQHGSDSGWLSWNFLVFTMSELIFL